MAGVRPHFPADGQTPLTRPLSTPNARRRGFTLLEVLIALVIAGMALATVFLAAGENMRASAAATRYQEAVSRARSHLDGTSANLVIGEQDGDDGGGFHWHVVVRAVGTTGKRDTAGKHLPSTDSRGVTLCAVTVTISWREGSHSRTVRLDSERLLTSAPG